jgi:hypothetical protein
MRKSWIPPNGPVPSAETERGMDDTILEKSGRTKLGPPAEPPAGPDCVGGDAPPPRKRVALYALARELGVTVARIIRLVSELLPSHRGLPSLCPTSLLGPRLADAIRQVLRGPDRPPRDLKDFVWEG